MLKARSSEARLTLWLHGLPARQWHACPPVAIQLFSPPLLWVYPSVRTGLLVLHLSLSLFLANIVPFSFHRLYLFPMGRDGIFNRTKEMVAGTEQERRQPDSPGLEIILHVFSFFLHFVLLSPLPINWHFDLLPDPFSLVSTTITITIRTNLIFPVSHSTSSVLLSLSHCCFFVFLCLFPLSYVVWAPAVDYQSVDSQRAAKPSRTNMKEYPNDWLVGCGPWKQTHISLSQAQSTGPFMNHITQSQWHTVVLVFVCSRWLHCTAPQSKMEWIIR